MIFQTDIPTFDEDILVIPVMSDVSKHWRLNRLSFFYVYAIESRLEYIFSVNHCDVEPIELPNKKFTNKRQFVYGSKILKGSEAKTLVWLSNNEITKIPMPTRVVNYHKRFNGVENINDSVPIVLFTEWLRNVKDDFMLSYNTFSEWESFEKYSDFHQELSKIEYNGLYTAQGYEYTEYNPFTLTGRPSNAFGGINYAALNKTDGSRNRFVSRFGKNGRLVEIDLKAFHINLLGGMVKYSFPDPDIYGYFQQFYPPGINPKEETFHQIYGGIKDEYLNIEFFKKVHTLTKNLYTEYELNSLRTPLFNRKINIKNLNDLKVINYILQATETEHNAILISELNRYLYTRPTKLILYTYDSFLFDFYGGDGKEVLDGIKDIFNGIPFTLKYGYDMGKLLTKSQ